MGLDGWAVWGLRNATPTLIPHVPWRRLLTHFEGLAPAVCADDPRAMVSGCSFWREFWQWRTVPLAHNGIGTTATSDHSVM